MSAKISKEDTDRQRCGRFVLTALTRQGPRVASLLGELAVPHLRPGDPKPDFHGTVIALARRLETSLERLKSAGHALYDASARLVALRELRDHLTAKLASDIVRLRRLALSRYVAPNLVALGLYSPRSYRPDPLLRQIELVEEAFQRGDWEHWLDEPIDRDATGLGSFPDIACKTGDRLRTTLDRIDDARRQYDEALIARNEARDDHDELFVYTARTYEGYCRLAGLEELARRVRPSVKRPGRTERKPDEEFLLKTAPGTSTKGPSLVVHSDRRQLGRPQHFFESSTEPQRKGPLLDPEIP